MICLIRVDPMQNMNRWYYVAVQPTLFDEFAVICGWGRRGPEQAQWRILPVESQQEADELAERMVSGKIQRGYQRLVRAAQTE